MVIKDEKFEHKGFIFEISYISERGGRTVNEDTVMVASNKENILLAIADGLGAHGGGDIASATAANIAKEEYMKITKIKPKDMFNIFQTIDNAIVAAQTDKMKMKTTLSCVFVRDKWLYAAHLGDTRIYTFRGDKEIYLTEDHSVAYEEVMKNHGTLDDIRKNSNRHILKAALGVEKMRTPDIFRQKINRNLSVLICSDGFWEYVNEDEMLEALRNTATSHEWLEAMLKCHSEKADTFNDNYSAISLRIITKSKMSRASTGGGSHLTFFGGGTIRS